MIKRFGVVVRHHELGYRANAMVVFDVPDAEVDRIGAQLAGRAGCHTLLPAQPQPAALALQPVLHGAWPLARRGRSR
jgi:DNA-binding Lrp family transcriptional regulator